MATKSTGKKEWSEFKKGDPVWIYDSDEYKEAYVADVCQDIIFFRIDDEDFIYSSRETEYYPRNAVSNRDLESAQSQLNAMYPENDIIQYTVTPQPSEIVSVEDKLIINSKKRKYMAKLPRMLIQLAIVVLVWKIVINANAIALFVTHLFLK